MSKMTRTRRTVKYESAGDWPAWTDDVRFVPTEADAAEHASWNDEWHDQDAPAADDPIWDRWAEEAHAAEMTERGLRPY